MMRILLVEDDYISQVLAKILLTEMFTEATLDTAASAAEALDLALLHAYNLILTDIGLPDLRGDELVRKIKEKSRFNRNTPIIALTAHGEYEQDLINSSGIVMTIIKPLSYEHKDFLAQYIRSAL